MYIYTDSLWGTLKESFTPTRDSNGNFVRETNFTSAGDYIIGLYGSATGNYSTKNFMCTETTPTTYEPYGVNTWYIEKNINKVLVTTAMIAGFQNPLTNTKEARIYKSTLNCLLGAEARYFCDTFSFADRTWNVDTLGIMSNAGVSAENISLRIPVDSDRSYFNTHPTTLYYQLANPTYEIITNENLIEQLNNLQNIELIENLCYVDWVGSESPTMSLTYYQGRTLEEIDEEYLKDVNVGFGEKYGPINSIVLSRSGESDNVYIQDEDSIDENGLHELKIIDNQLMNFNDRSDYLQDLLNKLDGLEYYINDFVSTGICYLELGDRYYVTIGDNRYGCIMFNDELEITGGLKELIYTDMPEQTETDYKKADKTDRRINQTYIIVDKQNQTIESLANEIGDRSEKTTTITQDIDSIEATVEAFADVTVEEESGNATISFEKINASEPIMLKVHPLANTNISYSYYNLISYPSDTQYLDNRTIRFIRTYEEDGETKTENIDYEIPNDLLYYNANNYDEFELDYVNKQCKVIKKCAYNSSGQVVLTGSTQTIEYEYPRIILPEGDYQVKILSRDVGYIYAKLMIQNEYTSQFTTEVQVQSQIKITADGIESQVSQKVGNDEIISKINQSAEGIQISGDKINIEGKAVNFTTNIINQYIYSASDLERIQQYLMGEIQLNSEETEIYDVDGDGLVSPADYIIIQNAINNNDGVIEGTFSIDPYSTTKSVVLTNKNGETKTYVGLNGIASGVMSAGTLYADTFYLGTQNVTTDTNYVFGNENWIEVNAGTDNTMISADEISVMNASSSSIITANSVTTPQVIQTSKEEDKKNFERLKSGLDIVLNTDIYKYHLKTQSDEDKKHIGFVIGEDFRHAKEITSEKDGKEIGVDLYSMVAACYKAIQEQQNKIEELEKRLKGGN